MQKDGLFSQRIRKLILLIVGILIPVLILLSFLYEPLFKAKKAENWEIFTPQNSGLLDASIRTIAVDPSGEIWVGTNVGISIFDGENWESYVPDSFYYVGEIVFDESGRAWCETNNPYTGGVSVFDGENWISYTPENSGLRDSSIRTIAADPSGKIWVGTDSGVSVFDGEIWQSFTPEDSGLIHKYVNSIAIDRSGKVWIATQMGLNVLDGDDWGSYTAENSSLLFDTVFNVGVDPSDQVWLRTYDWEKHTSNNVSVFDGEDWVNYQASDSGLVEELLSDESAMTMYDEIFDTIAIDSAGQIWKIIFGGREGDYISVFDGDGWTTYTERNSGIVSDVKLLVADDKGDIWIAAGDGLNHVRAGESLQVNPVLQGIWDILLDRELALWINIILLIMLGITAIINDLNAALRFFLGAIAILIWPGLFFGVISRIGDYFIPILTICIVIAVVTDIVAIFLIWLLKR